MDMKRCFKCLRELPLSAFYRHAMMADGHLNKCGDCSRADVKRHRLANLDKVRKYDRDRSAQPQRAQLRERVTALWRQANPDGAKAHRVAGNAVRDGKLLRLMECEGCGRDSVPLDKHHPDYSEPLFVIWLCKPCHAIADKIRRRVEARSEAS